MNKIKLFFNEKNSVKSAAIILIITLLLSNILGMLRDHFIAQKIPTDILDTYYAAFRIPDLIFNLLILGAIAAAFIPVFTAYLAKKETKHAWHIANSFINLSIIMIVILAVIMAFIMPKIMPLIVPDFDKEKLDLTIKLARMMLISPILFGISYIFGGILNSYKRFVIYSIAPLVYNLSIIIATITLADRIGIIGVVYGVIIGAFMHMIIQLPFVIKLGYKYSMIADYKDPGVRRIFILMIPRAIGLGAMQLMLLVYTYIASKLNPGSIAIFNLADNIQTMPVVVFGTSFATALFPSLTESISLKKYEVFSNYFWRGTRAVLYLLIPAGIGIILLRTQIVRLILGSGHFGWEQTIDTSNVLGFFAVSLFAQGLIPLFARSFYAYQNTRIPMYVSVASFVISIILGFVLAPIYGIIGLAIAFSIGSITNALFLYLIFRNKINLIKNQEKNIIIYLLKILFASILMGTFVQLSKTFVGSFVNMDKFWGVFVQSFAAILIGVIVYFIATYFMKCEEIKEISSLIKKRFLVLGTPKNQKEN